MAGPRLRRAVAEVLQVPLEDVLVQGYTNDYGGYVTTPEECDEQRYEGGHTMFGRWQLPTYLQEVSGSRSTCATTGHGVGGAGPS